MAYNAGRYSHRLELFHIVGARFGAVIGDKDDLLS